MRQIDWLEAARQSGAEDFRDCVGFGTRPRRKGARGPALDESRSLHDAANIGARDALVCEGLANHGRDCDQQRAGGDRAIRIDLERFAYAASDRGFRYGSGSAVAGTSKPPFGSSFTPASGSASIPDFTVPWSQRRHWPKTSHPQGARCMTGQGRAIQFIKVASNALFELFHHRA